MELSEIRKEIDVIDDRMLELFLQRMSLVEEIANYKNERNMPIINRGREREILSTVAKQAGNRERYAYHLFSDKRNPGRITFQPERFGFYKIAI